MLIRRYSRKSVKASFVAGLLLSLCSIFGIGTLSLSSVYAEGVNCDANAVIAGGAATVSNLQNDYNNGASCVSNGITYSNKNYSIQDIYHAFGMGPSDISAMSSDAHEGYVTRSGDVYVGSALVATNAITAGRENIPGSTQHHYGATTFYERPPSVGFAPGVTQLTAMVIMQNGVFQHAIFHSCGNPVNGTPTTKPPTPPPPKPVAPACVSLSGSIPGDNNQMVRTFTATASFGSGETFTSADFYFGDGNSKLNVQPTAGAKTVSVTYTYATPGTYNAQAILHFSVSGSAVTAPACAAVVSPTTPPTPECKPGVPVGSPMCSPCQYDTSLPSNSPQCVAPTPPSLPNTGAGDTIAIFAVVVIAGFLVYRQVIFRKHRAAFLAAERGTSPPLGDPLNESPQLHVAPQHHRKRSLRRKRQY